MNDKLYSDWHKIDLHIHTDKSKETKDGDYSGNFNVDVLHTKLVKNEVAIFSLTDHNIINVEAYKEYYNKYTSESAPKLFVGVELDIEIERESGEKKNYHTLLIFNHSNINGVDKINKALEDIYAKKGLSKFDRKLTIGELAEIFSEDNFFFIPHAGNSQSIVDAYKGDITDAQKMVILMQSAVEKVTNEEKKNKYTFGFDLKKPVSQRGKKDIAYINFSDNHNIHKYPCKHKGSTGDHNFYYIKGSKSFETIRLAFIDPESRIMSNEQYGAIRSNGSNIEKLRIENCEFIESVELDFSPSLNVIIGGRSSGKSLLMWLLCEKIDSLEPDTTYKLPSYRSIIKTKNDKEFKEKTSIDKDDVIRISQGEIVRYFEKQELEQLAYKVGKKAEYQSVYNEFSIHSNALNKIQNTLVNAYKEAYDETLSKTHILHLNTIKAINSKEIIFSIDSQKIVSGFDVSDEIENILNIIAILKENISKFTKHSLISLDVEQEIIKNQFLELLEIKNSKIVELQKMTSTKIGFVNTAEKIVTETNEKLSIKSSAKTTGKQELQRLKATIKSKFNKYANLKACCDNIEEFDYALCKEIDLYENIKLELEVSEETSLKAEILDALLKSHDGISLYRNILYLLYNKTTVKSYKDIKPESFQRKLESLITPIKTKMLKPNDYLRYSETETSKEKSPGYNSEKYLEIILKQTNTKTIIIDQPEDNLGNRFISKKLVTLLREIKNRKQIFLVTHNPSIVVYGDAESIILAQNDDNNISYKQIKLEDKTAQIDICDVLDGGEYIFKKRSDKYDIKSIITE